MDVEQLDRAETCWEESLCCMRKSDKMGLFGLENREQQSVTEKVEDVHLLFKP